MAKTTAPLMGFGAGGQLGKSVVHSSWRGVTYTRRYVTPANPQTSGQTTTRGAFAWLTQLWKLMTADGQAPWTAFARGRPLTNRNALIQQNLPGIRSASDLAAFMSSPGANGGIAATSIVNTPGTLSISCALGAPALPTGWTITKAIAMAILDGAAATMTTYGSYTAEDSSAPYAPAITVPATGTYRVFGWFQFLKPDGTTAYGPSINATAVVS
jgi:hypothetical protein